MEFGTPPLYSEVNRVARDMDYTQLENLGPFINAMGFATTCGERYKHTNDKIKPGRMISGEDQNLAGSFLLWRGTAMKDEWLEPYYKNIG